MNRKETNFISINPRNCIACWDCIEACPKQVIGKVQFLWHKHIVIKNANACIGCKRCIKACNQLVISDSKSNNKSNGIS